jgi:hypothetical protein
MLFNGLIGFFADYAYAMFLALMFHEEDFRVWHASALYWGTLKQHFRKPEQILIG